MCMSTTARGRSLGLVVLLFSGPHLLERESLCLGGVWTRRTGEELCHLLAQEKEGDPRR